MTDHFQNLEEETPKNSLFFLRLFSRTELLPTTWWVKEGRLFSCWGDTDNCLIASGFLSEVSCCSESTIETPFSVRAGNSNELAPRWVCRLLHGGVEVFSFKAFPGLSFSAEFSQLLSTPKLLCPKSSLFSFWNSSFSLDSGEGDPSPFLNVNLDVFLKRLPCSLWSTCCMSGVCTLPRTCWGSSSTPKWMKRY